MSRKIESRLEGIVKGRKSPLGLLYLFIVFVEGVAGLVLSSNSTIVGFDKTVLVLFITMFPIAIIATFFWLLVNHKEKLIWPSDFTSDKGYIEYILNQNSMRRVKKNPIIINELVLWEYGYGSNVVVKRDVQIGNELHVDGVYSKDGLLHPIRIVEIERENDGLDLEKLESDLFSKIEKYHKNLFTLEIAVVIRAPTERFSLIKRKIGQSVNLNINRRFFDVHELVK